MEEDFNEIKISVETSIETLELEEEEDHAYSEVDKYSLDIERLSSWYNVRPLCWGQQDTAFSRKEAIPDKKERGNFAATKYYQFYVGNKYGQCHENFISIEDL